MGHGPLLPAKFHLTQANIFVSQVTNSKTAVLRACYAYAIVLVT